MRTRTIVLLASAALCASLTLAEPTASAAGNTSAIANLSSGLIGALMGAVVVWFVSHRDRVHNARSRLKHLLLKNGHTIWWGQGDLEPWAVIEANYIDVQVEYLALRSLSLLRKRYLESAWAEYTGSPHYHDIPDFKPEKVFAKGPATREQALNRILGFLKAIG